MYYSAKELVSLSLQPVHSLWSLVIGLVAFAFIGPTLLPWLFFKRWPVKKGGAVLITGTSSGIGHETALEMIKQGYIVYATVRKIEDGRDLLAEAGANKDKLRPLLLDVRDHEAMGRVQAKVVADMKREHFTFAGVYANAGYMTMFPVEFHDIKDMEDMFQTNVFGNLRLIQQFLPLIREHKVGGVLVPADRKQGRIVLMSSLAGRLSQAKQGCYCATKHAIEAFGDALRQELYPYDVAVAMIEPGFTETPLVDKVLESEGKAAEDTTVHETYPWLYRPFQKAKIDMSAKLAGRVREPATEVVHAFTDPYPKTRYPCTNVGGIPASVVLFVRGSFNDRLFDWLLR